MKTYEAIFIDRDGTLNPDPGYINSLEQFTFYDFAIPALKLLARRGHRFCIVTNQSGVGRGIIAPRDLEKIHRYIENKFRENEIPLLGIYYCPDHPEQATIRRKPGPGMFIEAAREHQLDLTRCLMIGDAGSDVLAGAKLGMETMLVLTGRGSETMELLAKEYQPTYVVKDLLAGAHLILEEEKD
ncbi:MAG: HAD family hydrolase [FCB group bacterium]|nr:HAD family hydrolase [FCB group bacterium]